MPAWGSDYGDDAEGIGGGGDDDTDTGGGTDTGGVGGGSAGGGFGGDDDDSGGGFTDPFDRSEAGRVVNPGRDADDTDADEAVTGSPSGAGGDTPTRGQQAGADTGGTDRVRGSDPGPRAPSSDPVPDFATTKTRQQGPRAPGNPTDDPRTQVLDVPGRDARPVTQRGAEIAETLRESAAESVGAERVGADDVRLQGGPRGVEAELTDTGLREAAAADVRGALPRDFEVVDTDDGRQIQATRGGRDMIRSRRDRLRDTAVDGRKSLLLGPEASANPTDGPLAAILDPAGQDGARVFDRGDDPFAPDTPSAAAEIGSRPSDEFLNERGLQDTVAGLPTARGAAADAIAEGRATGLRGTARDQQVARIDGLKVRFEGPGAGSNPLDEARAVVLDEPGETGQPVFADDPFTPDAEGPTEGIGGLRTVNRAPDVDTPPGERFRGGAAAAGGADRLIEPEDVAVLGGGTAAGLESDRTLAERLGIDAGDVPAAAELTGRDDRGRGDGGFTDAFGRDEAGRVVTLAPQSAPAAGPLESVGPGRRDAAEGARRRARRQARRQLEEQGIDPDAASIAVRREGDQFVARATRRQGASGTGRGLDAPVIQALADAPAVGGQTTPVDEDGEVVVDPVFSGEIGAVGEQTTPVDAQGNVEVERLTAEDARSVAPFAAAGLSAGAGIAQAQGAVGEQTTPVDAQGNVVTDPVDLGDLAADVPFVESGVAVADDTIAEYTAVGEQTTPVDAQGDVEVERLTTEDVAGAASIVAPGVTLGGEAAADRAPVGEQTTPVTAEGDVAVGGVPTDEMERLAPTVAPGLSLAAEEAADRAAVGEQTTPVDAQGDVVTERLTTEDVDGVASIVAPGVTLGGEVAAERGAVGEQTTPVDEDGEVVVDPLSVDLPETAVGEQTTPVDEQGNVVVERLTTEDVAGAAPYVAPVSVALGESFGRGASEEQPAPRAERPAGPLSRVIQDEGGLPAERPLTADVRDELDLPNQAEVRAGAAQPIEDVTGEDPRDAFRAEQAAARGAALETTADAAEFAQDRPVEALAVGAPVAVAEPTPAGEVGILAGLTAGAIGVDVASRIRAAEPDERPTDPGFGVPEIGVPDERPGTVGEIDVPAERPRTTTGELGVPEGRPETFAEVDVPDRPAARSGELGIPEQTRNDVGTIRTDVAVGERGGTAPAEPVEPDLPTPTDPLDDLGREIDREQFDRVADRPAGGVRTFGGEATDPTFAPETVERPSVPGETGRPAVDTPPVERPAVTGAPGDGTDAVTDLREQVGVGDATGIDANARPGALPGVGSAALAGVDVGAQSRAEARLDEALDGQRLAEPTRTSPVEGQAYPTETLTVNGPATAPTTRVPLPDDDLDDDRADFGVDVGEEIFPSGIAEPDEVGVLDDAADAAEPDLDFLDDLGI